MADKIREEEWMEYLRLHPKKAKSLIKEAQGLDIMKIEEKYSDVIKAYNETKTVLDRIIVDMVAMQKGQKSKDKLSGGWSKALQQAYENGEKEWDSLSYEFHVTHGKRYDAYKQEIASCKSTYAKLQSLILD